MVGNVDFKITGAREFERLLKEVGEEAAGKIGRQSLRAGAKVLQEEAQVLVPVQTGSLAESIAVNAPTKTDMPEANVVIRGPIWNHLWHVVEFGTRYTPARSFLRAAMDSKANETLAAISKAMKRGIERETKKLAKPIR